MTLAEYLKKGKALLERAGIPRAFLDAELLVSYVLNISRSMVLAHDRDELSEAQLSELDFIFERRARREPLAYITGEKEFYGLLFSVTPDVLIPRPETEHLVEAALGLLPDGGEVLDLCTGSGIIGLTIKHERPDATVTLSDLSRGALEVARNNARRLFDSCNDITVIESDLFSGISGTFDLIATNPPYIDPAEAVELEAELGYEPQMALFSQGAGEAIPGAIVRESQVHLKPGGSLLMEIHAKKDDFIKKIAEKSGFTCSIVSDYAGHPRVACLARKVI